MFVCLKVRKCGTFARTAGKIRLRLYGVSLLFCWKCENVLVLDRQLDIIFIARLKNSNIHFNKKVRYTFKNICLCRDFNFGVPIFCVFRKEIRLIFKFIGKMFVGKCFYLKGCCTIEHIKTFASSKLVLTQTYIHLLK